MSRRIVALLLAATAIATPVQAATITETYSFTGTNFGGSIGPSDVLSVAGQFTLTYDPTISSTGTVDSFSIDTDHPSFNLPTVSFENFISVGGFRNLWIGGTGATAGAGPNTAGSLWFQDFDFNISIGYLPDGSISQFGRSIGYASHFPQPHGLYFTDYLGTQIQLIDNPTIGAVPEPATWAFLILGFGAAGATLRRRRLVLAQA